MGVQDYPLSFYLRILSQPKRQDYRTRDAQVGVASGSDRTNELSESRMEAFLVMRDADWC
jgi:hypothetical protein